MSLIYKTLFEIKLLHEYFLTSKDGSTIFEKPNQGDRLNYLQNEFTDDREAINNDIQFEFPETLKSKFESHFLKLIPSYSGCKVAVRVNQRMLPDQSLVFEPSVPLTNDLDIFILLSRKNYAIDSYTNARLYRPNPSIYYFSNEDLLGPKTVPFLTNTIPVFNSSFLYEQGELSFAGAVIREFYREGGADQWNDVTGAGFVNESDRLLLPQKFHYSFADTTNLTNAIFVLKDRNGNEIANIIENNTAGLRKKILLDFSGKAKLLPGENQSQVADLIYTLEVNGNNGYTANHRMIFSDKLIKSDPWAVLNIRTTVTNPGFNLFANDGFIIRRKNGFGVWTPAPVFEIPVKSRFVYWRFINNKGRELNVSTALTDYLNKENNVLITKKPRSISRSYFLLRKEGTADTAYVPNPTSVELMLESDRRLCFNIRVPESELFPVAP